MEPPDKPDGEGDISEVGEGVGACSLSAVSIPSIQFHTTVSLGRDEGEKPERGFKLTLGKVRCVCPDSRIPTCCIYYGKIPQSLDWSRLGESDWDEHNASHDLYQSNDNQKPLKPGVDSKQTNEQNCDGDSSQRRSHNRTRQRDPVVFENLDELPRPQI